ncbi:hypothetical protein ACHAPJ_007076 [Fusarium lateritium]
MATFSKSLAYQQDDSVGLLRALRQRDDPEKHRTRNPSEKPGYTEGSIPSWSWASVDAHVITPQDWEYKSLCSSFKAWFCEYDPPGSLLQVRRAWIEIEGPLALVVRCKKLGRKDDLMSDHKILVVYNTGHTMWEKLYLDDDAWSLEDGVAAKTIYLMIIGDSLIDYCATALILQETGKVGDIRRFRRVGLAVYNGKLAPWEYRELIRLE